MKISGSVEVSMKLMVFSGACKGSIKPPYVLYQILLGRAELQQMKMQGRQERGAPVFHSLSINYSRQ